MDLIIERLIKGLEHLAQLDDAYQTQGNRIFFLAVAPQYFGTIAGSAFHGMATNVGAWQRWLWRNPWYDLTSARQLNTQLAAFGEQRVYGLTIIWARKCFRISWWFLPNTLFEPPVNSDTEVQITVSETVGVGSRGPYYEAAGALRDMVQNHMLQLLTLIAMEPPVALDADSVRDEKVKVLRSLRPLTKAAVTEQVVRGQYGPGSIDGETVLGYRQEERVDPASNTDTYVALELYIDNFRWSGVPFYLRTGKRLPVRSAEIVIRFREQPGVLYFAQKHNTLGPNLLVIKIQPEEGIFLQFNARKPGTQHTITPVTMDYCQNCLEGLDSPEAYERLLADVMRGDSTLFTRWDEVEYAWDFVDKISHVWEEMETEIDIYSAGSWGPRAAERLLARNGHRWLLPFSVC